jgi:two-component system, chemotaxis family, chemotaxis protein CheY
MDTSGDVKVLVVEDNSALANVLKFNLERSGYVVTIARNGREAWDMLANLPVDLIIADHQMPEMTGIELCQRVRGSDHLRATPFMLVTAKRLEIDIDQIRAKLNITRTFSKPFSPAAIINAVRDEMSLAR